MGEDALAAVEFAKFGIGEIDFVTLAGKRKFDKTLWVKEAGKIAEEQSVDEGKDGHICADAQGEKRELRRS